MRLLSALLLLTITTPEAPDPQPEPPALRVDLNTATEAELVRLPGVGPKRARAIIEQRERAPFRRLRDLKKVRGIGHKRYRQLLSHIWLPSIAPPPRKARVSTAPRCWPRPRRAPRPDAPKPCQLIMAGRTWSEP